jgi:ornithine cyclodeaminase
MTAVYSLAQIKKAVAGLDALPAIEAGFVAYSKGEAVVPPVGELIFADPPGEAHIKYGYLRGDNVFVVKVATGFYENPKHGLPASSGLMLVFDSRTGVLLAVLLEEGFLTNVRTALAGAISAKYLARKPIECIAVLGTGVQARMQAEEVAAVVGCKRVAAWGRRTDALDAYRRDMQAKGFEVSTMQNVGAATRNAHLIITTTASETPILDLKHVAPGTHIVAMGSDTEAKNELSIDLIGAADVYVTDSLLQCSTRGELHHALRAGVRRIEDTVELGQVIADPTLGRANEAQITIADLTGVAVQDIAIAKAVCAVLAHRQAKRGQT